MNVYRTPQEEFWAGEFGDNYVDRNQEMLPSNIALFTKILSSTHNVQTVIEFGANIGLNLSAIRILRPSVKITAVEINKKAVTQLEQRISDVKIYNTSILDFNPDRHDLSLSKGVLIHINPDILPVVYDLIYSSSSRYICLAEYYSPAPVEVSYRGHQGKLFKRDFAGEMLDRFDGLTLIDYGFIYHRDNNFKQDDLTWFLMEK